MNILWLQIINGDIKFMDVVEILYKLAPHVHIVAFGLLVLAGLNIPISEDLVVIVSGSIAASIIPENTVMIFLSCLIGSFLSDVMVYAFGLLAAEYWLHTKWFKRIVSFDKIKKMKRYFINGGVKTLFFGRMIPLFRNMVFFTAGIARMNFWRFIVSDFFSLCITTAIIFTVGYLFGKNIHAILPYLDAYKYGLLLAFIFVAGIIYLYRNKDKYFIIKNTQF